MSCQSCLGTDCVGGYSLDDVDLYSIQGDAFIPVFECPQGFDCQGFRNFGSVYLQCCDELLTQTYVVPISNADYNRIVQGLVTQCAARAPFCAQPIKPGQPPPIFYYNRPSICVVNCPLDGLPFSYTVPAGIVLGFSQAKADKAAESLACSLAKIHRICLSSLPKFCCAGVAYSKTITATGVFLAKPGQFNFWQVSGTLPTGLTFNGGSTQSATVSITGTPTTPGSYSFTVTVTDPSGDIMTKTYTICVIGITSVPAGSDSAHLPDATIGAAYSATLTLPTCASAFGLIFEIDAGELPDGLDLDPITGVISGTPTDVADDYPITVRLLNASGQTVCSKNFTLTLGAGLTATAYYTLNSADGSGNLIDSVASLPMFKQAGLASAYVPALISNGIERTDTLKTQYTTGLVAALPYPDTGGWSEWGWFKILGQGSASVGSELIFATFFSSIFIDVGNTDNPGNVEVSWTDSLFQSVQTYLTVSTGNWHFFHLYFDPVTQKIGISIDNGAPTLTGTGVVWGVSAKSVWDFFGPSVSFGLDIVWDEIGLKLDRKLTSAEQTALWNGGAGKTYPF